MMFKLSQIETVATNYKVHLRAYQLEECAASQHALTFKFYLFYMYFRKYY